METHDIIRAVAALSSVLALIACCAWAARRLNLEKRLAGMRKDARLHLVESLYIDSRHRVVILRRDAREHVLLVSANETVVVESYDVAS